MLDDHGFETYEENEFPLAYLITFRTLGTWLHGDDRTSINRSNRDVPGPILLDRNLPLREKMQSELKGEAVLLTARQRNAVDVAIRQLCFERGYALRALNVRSNHVHSVIGAKAKPERIADAMKAFATKRLRELGSVGAGERVWSRGRSRRYLWKPKHVEAAVNYVLHCQGDAPFKPDEWLR